MRLLLGVMVVLPGVMDDRLLVADGGLANPPAALAAAAAASDGWG